MNDERVLVMHENIHLKINGCESIEIPKKNSCLNFLALPHVRDTGIFSQLFVFFFSQEKEKHVFYFVLKLC